MDNTTRQSAKVDRALLEQLRQRVTGIALGCPDGNDAARLREDPMLKLACNRDPVKGDSLASQPTLSRFENSVDNGQLLAMGYGLASTVIAETWTIVMDPKVPSTSTTATATWRTTSRS